MRTPTRSQTLEPSWTWTRYLVENGPYVINCFDLQTVLARTPLAPLLAARAKGLREVISLSKGGRRDQRGGVDAPPVQRGIVRQRRAESTRKLSLVRREWQARAHTQTPPLGDLEDLGQWLEIKREEAEPVRESLQQCQREVDFLSHVIRREELAPAAPNEPVEVIDVPQQLDLAAAKFGAERRAQQRPRLCVSRSLGTTGNHKAPRRPLPGRQDSRARDQAPRRHRVEVARVQQDPRRRPRAPPTRRHGPKTPAKQRNQNSVDEQEFSRRQCPSTVSDNRIYKG